MRKLVRKKGIAFSGRYWLTRVSKTKGYLGSAEVDLD